MESITIPLHQLNWAYQQKVANAKHGKPNLQIWQLEKKIIIVKA